MATAQQKFVDQFVAQINGNVNLNSHVIASSPSAGLLRVTATAGETPTVGFLLGGSSVTGAGTFVTHPATGSPQYTELYFSWTLAPGDRVKLNTGVLGRSSDLTYTMPTTETVDTGGFDHTAVAAGGGGGGSPGGVAVGGTGVGSAQHRRLVVMECGSASPSFGSLFALDPQDATGVPIPTFRVSAGLPATGVTVGESVYSTATRNGYVWDGTAWREITASPIRSFLNDTALQADVTEKIGTYAVASDTGNMYVKIAGGWRRIGIAEFPTYAALNAWDAVVGTEALSYDLDVLFLRIASGTGRKWIPTSLLVKNEADILTSANVAGLAAIAEDTGATFVNNGTRWIQDPIEHYTTEALLLAATAPDGHMAWADDTNVVFTRAGGTWHRLQGPQISVGTSAPATPGAGDLWFDSSSNRKKLNIYTGSEWLGTNGTTVGKAGSGAVLPGYFQKDPSATNTSSDTGALAFRYNGSHSRLFINKGAVWNPITPEVGDPSNEDKFVRADSNGNPEWSRHGSMQVMHSADGTGNANTLVHVFGLNLKRALRQHGSFAPKQNFCYPKIICIHDGNWMNWSDSNLAFEGSCMIRWKDGGVTREDLASASNANGGLLVYGDDSYAVGQHSPCPFEFKILGFGLQGTNDYCQVVYRLGPYKNKNNDWITVDGMYRMGAGFNPTKIDRMGIKFDDHGNKGPVSLTTEFF